MCGVMPGKARCEPSKRRRRIVVVGVIVDAYEALGAVGIGEDPGAKALFDALLLLARRQRVLLVEDALFLAVPLEHVIDGRAFQVEGLLQQPDAVGALGAVVGGGGHGRARR